MNKKVFLIVLIALISLTSVLAAEYKEKVNIFESDTEWVYSKTDQEEWKSKDFNDDEWATKETPFTNGDILKEWTRIYARKKFTVEKPSKLQATGKIDNDVTCWLNEKEIGSASGGPADYDFVVDYTNVLKGENIIACDMVNKITYGVFHMTLDAFPTLCDPEDECCVDYFEPLTQGTKCTTEDDQVGECNGQGDCTLDEDYDEDACLSNYGGWLGSAPEGHKCCSDGDENYFAPNNESMCQSTETEWEWRVAFDEDEYGNIYYIVKDVLNTEEQCQAITVDTCNEKDKDCDGFLKNEYNEELNSVWEISPAKRINDVNTGTGAGVCPEGKVAVGMKTVFGNRPDNIYVICKYIDEINGGVVLTEPSYCSGGTCVSSEGGFTCPEQSVITGTEHCSRNACNRFRVTCQKIESIGENGGLILSNEKIQSEIARTWDCDHGSCTLNEYDCPEGKIGSGLEIGASGWLLCSEAQKVSYADCDDRDNTVYPDALECCGGKIHNCNEPDYLEACGYLRTDYKDYISNGEKWVACEKDSTLLEESTNFLCLVDGEKYSWNRCCGDNDECFNSNEESKTSDLGQNVHKLTEDFNFKLKKARKISSPKHFKINYWGGYDSLEFYVKSDQTFKLNARISDSAGNTKEIKNIIQKGINPNFKKLGDWQYVRILIDDLESGLDLKNIERITFFLESRDFPDNTEYTYEIKNMALRKDQNFYCTGNGWESSINEKEACESNNYVWTGNLCCGDSSNEYYVDSEGACWNGIAITKDNNIGRYTTTVDGNDKKFFYSCNQEFCNFPFFFDNDDTEINAIAKINIKSAKNINFFPSGNLEIDRETYNNEMILVENDPENIKTLFIFNKTKNEETGRLYSCMGTDLKQGDLNIGEEIILIGDECTEANDYVCNHGIWENKFVDDKIKDTSSPSPTGQLGCCPSDYCYDSTEDICVQSGEYFERDTAPDASTEEDEVINICSLTEQGADWQIAKNKPNFYNDSWSFCGETQCWDSTKCKDSNWFHKTEDQYCQEGNWTTRTKIVATLLLDIVDGTYKKDNYVLYCDQPQKALNNFHSLFPEESAGYQYMEDYIINSDKTNNFCVLTYDQEAIVGTSLNQNIDATPKAFIDIFGLEGSCVWNENDEGDFKKCTIIENGVGKLNVWYNNKTKTVFFSNDLNLIFGQLSLWEQVQVVLKNPIDSLMDGIRSIWNPNDPQKISNLFEVHYDYSIKNYNRLYLAKQGGIIKPKEITGTYEFVANQKITAQPVIEFITIRYKGFDDVCNAFDENECECDDNFCYFATRDSDRLKIWNEITAKLRFD